MVERTICEHRRRVRAVLRRASETRLSAAFAALLICAASFGAHAETALDEMTATIKPGTFGCPSYEDAKDVMFRQGRSVDKLVELAVQYKCVALPNGQAVTIMDKRFFFRCVKLLDDSACYWTRYDWLRFSD
jgi:hypothetical protein